MKKLWLVEYVPNDQLVVEANPNYWGQKPRVPAIQFLEWRNVLVSGG
jgi:ABC-type transport system substrate-binding protein